MGREGERRREKRGEAKGRKPQRRSWGGTCSDGRPGAWAAVPTTFTRETGNLRARGAPLPAQPPSYIRDTCPEHRLPCACAAADSGRGATAGGTGNDGNGATMLSTTGLVGGWLRPGQRWRRWRCAVWGRRERFSPAERPDSPPFFPGRAAPLPSAALRELCGCKPAAGSAACCWPLNPRTFYSTGLIFFFPLSLMLLSFFFSFPVRSKRLRLAPAMTLLVVDGNACGGEDRRRRGWVGSGRDSH